MKKVGLSPKKLFLIDGFGAVLSALLLVLIALLFEPLFGMPKRTLYILAAIPVVYAVYSFTCYVRLPANWQSYLKGIAYANLGYCCLTLLLVVIHLKILTTVGVVYFIGESIIIIVLAGIEFRMTRNGNIN